MYIVQMTVVITQLVVFLFQANREPKTGEQRKTNKKENLDIGYRRIKKNTNKKHKLIT